MNVGTVKIFESQMRNRKFMKLSLASHLFTKVEFSVL